MTWSQNADRLITTILPIPHMLINVLVIFLSIRKVRHTIVKIYALNLTVPSLVYSIYSTMTTVLRLVGSRQHFGLSTEMNRSTLDYTIDFVLYFCAYDYRMLAILLVAITYVSFAHPLFAKRHFVDRTVHGAFAVAHLAALLVSVVATFSDNQSEMLFLKYSKLAPLNWSDYVEGAVETFSFFILVFLYIICIQTIISFNRRPRVVSEAFKNDKNRYYMKRQLLMILLYITPPNLFLIPNSLCTDITTIFFSYETVVYHQICYAKVHYRASLLTCRLFVASLTILFVFTDYRKALRALVSRKTRVFVVKSDTLTVSHRT